MVSRFLDSSPAPTSKQSVSRASFLRFYPTTCSRWSSPSQPCRSTVMARSIGRHCSRSALPDPTDPASDCALTSHSETPMETYTRFLLRHRFTVLAVVFATLLVSVWLARDVRIRFQYRDFYTYDGNPQLPIFDAYHRDFGDPG